MGVPSALGSKAPLEIQVHDSLANVSGLVQGALRDPLISWRQKINAPGPASRYAVSTSLTSSWFVALEERPGPVETGTEATIRTRYLARIGYHEGQSSNRSGPDWVTKSKFLPDEPSESSPEAILAEDPAGKGSSPLVTWMTRNTVSQATPTSSMVGFTASAPVVLSKASTGDESSRSQLTQVIQKLVIEASKTATAGSKKRSHVVTALEEIDTNAEEIATRLTSAVKDAEAEASVQLPELD